MSGAGDEEAMDSSAVSEEEVDESVPGRSCSKISDVGEIIEGKRAKKAVERLDFQAPKAKEKLKIADGGGDKLGDIPRTNYEINKRKAEELKLLHAILFDRPGKSASVKKNLRLFNGFPFEAGSPEFTKKRTKMLKSYNLTNAKLKLICTVLDLEKKGTQSDLVDRILNFLVAPKNSGKRAPVKKKRRSKKKLSGDDSKAQSKRSRPKAQSSSSGAKKSKAGSKSKAIVMDSSSDEEEEDEEKLGASVEAQGSDGEEKASEPDGEEEEQSEESEESDESSKPKSSRGKKKNAAEKRQRTPAKKTAPPKKRPKNQSPDESDGDSGAEEKPKKKKVAAAKTKKADSSSNNNSNIKTAEDSSDDDEPLIRMIKKAPTDDQLKATVEKLLKEANLEEMTMKQICQKVFDTYPEHDLSSRKDFIKQTVKALIT